MNKPVLLLIDIQNVYFTEGEYKLSDPEAAAENAAKILAFFRKKGLPVIHVKHQFKKLPGYKEPLKDLNELHSSVFPEKGELVIGKTAPNSFYKTELLEALRAYGADHVVVAGMMTHMCVDTTVRAARDYSLPVTVIGDACATKSLAFNGRTYEANVVHGTFLAALGDGFAKIENTEVFLDGLLYSK